MKHAISVAAAALIGMLFLADHSVYAQNAQASTDETDAVVVYTDADAGAVLDARIAALKTVLKLSAEQETHWAPLETAIRKITADSIARGEDRSNAPPPADFLEVLKRVAAAEATRAADLSNFVEAATPLVSSLSEEQKNRAPAFLGMFVDPEKPLSTETLWLFEEEER